jgi:hypothetical protein
MSVECIATTSIAAAMPLAVVICLVSLASAELASHVVTFPAPARTAIMARRPDPDPISRTWHPGHSLRSSATAKASLRSRSFSMAKCHLGIVRIALSSNPAGQPARAKGSASAASPDVAR